MQGLTILEREILVDGYLTDLRDLTRKTVETAWLLGGELRAIRDETPHGEWLPWIESRGLSSSSAYRFIWLAENYTDEGIKAFGTVDAALKALTFTKAGDEPDAETSQIGKSDDAALGDEEFPDFGDGRIVVFDDADAEGRDPDLFNEAWTGDDDDEPPEVGDAPPAPADDLPVVEADVTESLTPTDKKLLRIDELEAENEALRGKVEDQEYRIGTLTSQVEAVKDMDRPQLQDGVAQIANVRAELRQEAAEKARLATIIGDLKREVGRLKRDKKALQKEVDDYKRNFGGA